MNDLFLISKYPETPAEWQEAVDLAYGASCLESARNYGIVKGGPVVNQARCDFILSEGLKLGVRPSPGAAERFAVACMEPSAKL